jgi:ABC-type multidrug transport system fused ATPase/permease subunit
MILLISEICITLGIIVSLLLYDTIVISGLLSFFTLFSLIFYFLTRKKLLSWGEERQIIDEKINVNLLQSLGGIKEIIQYGKSLFFEKIHTKLIDKKAKINIWTLFLQQIPRYFLEIIFLLGIFLLYIYISNTENLIKFTSLLGILTFSAFRFLPSINKIISSIVGIKFSLPAANILFHEFSNINYKIISNNICPKINFKNIIELENITFAYNLESNEVINIQKLTINKGDIIGFHGQSGSGKSTLLDIIMGVLQPTTGKVSVDGIDISNNLKEWHKLIGYVPQSVFLLDDTIKKNVAFGLNDNEIDEYRVIKSLEYAELGDYKNIFPQGLNTMVGERGVGISGGQVQRIAIARALYINPEILVFDEFTSSLDKNTEQSIIGTIKKIANDKTIFIISHNLLPLTICDKVYEIQNGLIK